MAFDKKGSPEPTLSVLKEDGKAATFCASCRSMSEGASMDKKAFSDAAPSSRCPKCGKPS